uniref:EPS8 signaling adaptor L3 n=1 Tax=Ficedula albicollis TaxID=59894 RepID=U3JK07_FICAL
SLSPHPASASDQRKDYGQTLLKLQNDFQHHVEHLLTMHLERDLRSAEDCLGRLKELEEQGRIWGQDVILAVKDQELVLSDVESKEELEAFPLGSVQGCSAGLDNTVLAINVQERSPPRTSVLLFQCERLGVSPEGEKWGDSPPESPQADGRRSVPGRDAEEQPGEGAPEPPQVPRTQPPAQAVSEADRDVVSPKPAPRDGDTAAPTLGTHTPCPLHPQEVLNHVLRDLELFTGRLHMALNSASTKKKKQKKKKSGRKGGQRPWGAAGGCGAASPMPAPALPPSAAPPPPPPPPPPPQLCPPVLAHCPSPGLAPAVESPLLLPEALQFLEQNLSDDDYGVWKSLGTAWSKSRAEYPNSDLVPAYTPVFSDGWLPPVMEQERHRDLQDTPPPASVSPAPLRQPSLSLPPGLVRALYDFQARNSQELSVRKGDALQVLDQQRKWWLVQDERGDRGHVPEAGTPGAWWRLQDSPPRLHPDSSPAEVAAWLTDKGFSRITVRTLGVLPGQELLQMSPAELRAVCPEEWRRVLFKLSPIRTSLGPHGLGDWAPWGRDPPSPHTHQPPTMGGGRLSAPPTPQGSWGAQGATSTKHFIVSGGVMPVVLSPPQGWRMLEGLA